MEVRDSRTVSVFQTCTVRLKVRLEVVRHFRSFRVAVATLVRT